MSDASDLSDDRVFRMALSMRHLDSFVDIHCHLLPGLDDGASDWDTSLGMGRIAVEDGISTIVTTPHQLGKYAANDGVKIRTRTRELQQFLNRHDVPLRVLPGGDVRIEDGIVEKLQRGEVLTLADHGRHVLLELPHELYLPLERVVEALQSIGIVAILSHPERNRGLQQCPQSLHPLVDIGCLTQLTADSLTGKFGRTVQAFSETLIKKGLVHFVSTDAHGIHKRRPVLQAAFDRVETIADRETAIDLCCRNPASVTQGRDVRAGRRPKKRPRLVSWCFRSVGL